MKLLLYVSSDDSAAWQRAFTAALPEAEVRAWQPGLDWRADYAALWGAPSELLRTQPQLRAIFNLGAGADALLAVDALPRGIPIFRLEDAGMGREMLEYVTWAVLRCFRAFDRYAEQQARGEWRERRSRQHSDFPIGVMGLGVLGAHVARGLSALGFPVRGWSRTLKQIEGVQCSAGRGELDRFLANCRVLVCVLPHTPETHGLLDRTRLAQLPHGAHLINIGRGSLVVDADLLALLDSGHLAGATLDVFHQEPLPPEHPYWRHQQVVVTPHISGPTVIDAAAAQVADKIRRLERADQTTGLVDRNRGY